MRYDDDPILSEEEQIKVINDALRQYFKDVHHTKRVSSDLLEYATSNVLGLEIADAIAKAQHAKSISWHNLQGKEPITDSGYPMDP